MLSRCLQATRAVLYAARLALIFLVCVRQRTERFKTNPYRESVSQWLACDNMVI